MNKKDEYVRMMQARLDRWNYAIDTMGAKADKASSHSSDEYNGQIELLLSIQATAREKIKNLQESDESHWEELKPGMEIIWENMAMLMASAGHHFR
jgi:hypothetical protein